MMTTYLKIVKSRHIRRG